MRPNSAELLQRNAEYAVNHKPVPLIKDFMAMGTANLPRIMIITCADARVMPQSILGLEVGEALIFRTIAGHPQTALEAMVAIDIQAGGVLQEIMVLYHTDCGSQYFDVPQIRAGFAKREPSRSSEIESMTFGVVNEQYGAATLEEALRQDVEWLKQQPLLRQEVIVTGCMYDMETGRINQVV